MSHIITSPYGLRLFDPIYLCGLLPAHAQSKFSAVLALTPAVREKKVLNLLPSSLFLLLSKNTAKDESGFFDTLNKEEKGSMSLHSSRGWSKAAEIISMEMIEGHLRVREGAKGR